MAQSNAAQQCSLASLVTACHQFAVMAAAMLYSDVDRVAVMTVSFVCPHIRTRSDCDLAVIATVPDQDVAIMHAVPVHRATRMSGNAIPGGEISSLFLIDEGRRYPSAMTVPSGDGAVPPRIAI